MAIPLVATKRYQSQRVTSWRQPATQTNRDPDRDETLARSNHPTTSEIHRRQDDVFGYKLQFLLSAASIIIYGEDCLRCCPSNTIIKRDSNMFQAVGGLHEDNLCDTLRGTAPTNVKTLIRHLLIPYREQPRSTRIVVAYPRLAFSASPSFSRQHVMLE